MTANNAMDSVTVTSPLRARYEVSAFTLAHSTSTPSGVLITRYVRSGEVRTGTFEEVE